MLINFRVEYVQYAIDTSSMAVVEMPLTVYVSALNSQDAAKRALDAEAPSRGQMRITRVIQL